MEEALKERATILEKLLPNLFKAPELPDAALVKNICIHQELSNNPHKISAIKSIKVDIESVFEKFSPAVESSSKPGICALSQAQIIVPWKGDCGHFFEKSYVMDYLAKEEKYCPISGCRKLLQKKK